MLGVGDLEKAILTFVIFYCFEFLACIHFSFCYFGQHLAMSTMLVTLHLLKKNWPKATFTGTVSLNSYNNIAT